MAAVNKHIRQHREQTSYQCPTCKENFSTYSHLKVHSHSHPDNVPNKQHVKANKQHLKTKNDSVNCDIENQSPDTQKLYRCPTCNDCFTTYSHLKVHIKLHDEGGGTSLKENSVRPPLSEKLKSNASNVRGSLQFAMLKAKRLHQRFKYKKYFTAYIQPEKPFKCHICEKSWSSEVSLNRHVTVTHLKMHPLFQKKLSRCEVCKQGFMSYRQLKLHSKIHPGRHAEDSIGL